MSVKAKYIKDLPLKNEFDGSESLLVQDSNGTKQAPLEVIADEVKQNSQEKIREIESELNQTNAQLSNINKDLSEREINVLNYKMADELTIDSALERALEKAKSVGGVIFLPPSDTPYLISKTIVIGSEKDQRMFGFIGKSSSGSYYGEKQVTIQRTNPSDSYTMLQVIGRGYTIENICFDGQNHGDLVVCGRGFEAIINNCRFYRAGNVGLKAYAFQNAQINSCFFDENSRGLVLDYQTTFGVCNTVFIDKCHFERNTDVDCSVALTEDGIHWCEFIYFNNCHFESTTNTGGVAKSVPLLAIGNVRNCYIDNSFFYGGKADLLRIDSQVDNGETKYKGVSVTNTSFVGHLTKHALDDNTPPRLINLKNGNGFHMSGCMFDCAKSEYLRIESTFGDDVTILPCFISSKRSGTTNVAIRDHRGYEKTIDKMELIPSMVIGHYRSLWEIGCATDSDDSSELNIKPLVDSRTISFDTKTGNKVMSMYMNNTRPKWGVFGECVEKQVITGSKNSNEALDNLLKALVKFGLIEDNTSE